VLAPTAQISFADSTVTSSKPLSSLPDMLGLSTSCHTIPQVGAAVGVFVLVLVGVDVKVRVGVRVRVIVGLGVLVVVVVGVRVAVGVLVAVAVGVRVAVAVGVAVELGFTVKVGVEVGGLHGLLKRSTRICWSGPEEYADPTAHTSLADTAATPFRSL
jgi:hypothetical protein